MVDRVEGMTQVGESVVVPVCYAATDNSQATPCILKRMAALVDRHQLPIILTPKISRYKLTQKYRQQLSAEHDCPFFIIDHKGELSLWINGISVAPNWVKLQRRIVTAGRKSELLLQAAKLTADMKALDATAGFGHDSLILASSGAQVTMLEREPILALLLLVEQQKLLDARNWHKLMSRLTILNCSAEHYLTCSAKSPEHDLVYLDPMFPKGSYDNHRAGKGAKVGKHMQALHGLVMPPPFAAEARLFDLAYKAVVAHSRGDGSAARLIIKRPVTATHLANKTPDEVWQNDVLRFDGYFS